MMEKHTKALEEWSIDRLIPYTKNAKKHPKEQIAKIARSIREHGLINPPNVEPDGTLITGHGRLLGLKELGWKTVPVFVRYDLSKAEAAAARLADNKVGEGDYDTNILQEELRWLASESIDLGDLGFDDRELSFLMEDIGEMTPSLLLAEAELPDELPEPPAGEPEIADLVEPRVPLAKVFEAKDMTASQARTLSRFLALIADGSTPVAALTRYAEGALSDA
ncbi:ParB/Srx family N-terminal domain-containing protein [Aeromonas hydrophila]